MRPKIGSSYRYAKAFLSLLSDKQEASFVKKIDELKDSHRALIHNHHYKKLSLNSCDQILLMWATEWGEAAKLPFFVSWIQLIIENNRQDNLQDILLCTHELYCDQKKIKDIAIITANRVAKNGRKEIQDLLPQNSFVHYHLDPMILGGMIVKIDGHIKDESTRSYLQDIKTHLMEAI